MDTPHRLSALGRIESLAGICLLVAFGAVALPGAADAQDPVPPTPMPEQEIDPEVREIQEELQEIQQQLEPIHQQAIQDPEIQDMLHELEGRVQTAMEEIDPEVTRLTERLTELQQEAQEAQQAQDGDRLQELMIESQQIQQQLEEAQAEAMQRPAIAEEVEAFEEAYIDKMIELDPEAEELMERADSLTEKLQEMGGADPLAPPGG